MRITVLGGCGAVGSLAVTMFASTDVFSEIVIGDIDVEKAEKYACMHAIRKIYFIHCPRNEEPYRKVENTKLQMLVETHIPILKG